jgi:hypothetical protein
MFPRQELSQQKKTSELLKCQVVKTTEVYTSLRPRSSLSAILRLEINPERPKNAGQI